MHEHPATPRTGDELHTVLVGHPIAGMIALWHDDSSVSYWRVEDAEILTSIGTGILARAQVGENRYREAGLFNPRDQSLALTSRYPNSEQAVGASIVKLAPVSQRKAQRTAARSDSSRFFATVGKLVLGAANRGEFLAVEAGGWDSRADPSVMMVVTRDDGGQWQSYVASMPVPRGVSVWRDEPLPVGDRDYQALIAPASTETVVNAASLAGLVVDSWRMPFLNLGLTFGPAPDGPWRE